MIAALIAVFHNGFNKTGFITRKLKRIFPLRYTDEGSVCLCERSAGELQLADMIMKSQVVS